MRMPTKWEARNSTGSNGFWSRPRRTCRTGSSGRPSRHLQRIASSSTASLPFDRPPIDMTDNRPDRIIANVPDGMQPLVLARLVEERLTADPDAPVGAVFVARDGQRLQRM